MQVPEETRNGEAAGFMHNVFSNEVQDRGHWLPKTYIFKNNILICCLMTSSTHTLCPCVFLQFMTQCNAIKKNVLTVLWHHPSLNAQAENIKSSWTLSSDVASIKPALSTLPLKCNSKLTSYQPSIISLGEATTVPSPG